MVTVIASASRPVTIAEHTIHRRRSTLLSTV